MTIALFTDDACQMIAEASRGVPRAINILCDTALVYGFAADANLDHRRARQLGHRKQARIRRAVAVGIGRNGPALAVTSWRQTSRVDRNT